MSWILKVWERNVYILFELFTKYTYIYVYVFLQHRIILTCTYMHYTVINYTIALDCSLFYISFQNPFSPVYQKYFQFREYRGKRVWHLVNSDRHIVQLARVIYRVDFGEHCDTYRVNYLRKTKLEFAQWEYAFETVFTELWRKYHVNRTETEVCRS